MSTTDVLWVFTATAGAIFALGLLLVGVVAIDNRNFPKQQRPDPEDWVMYFGTLTIAALGTGASVALLSILVFGIE